jgi:hypothetical protein
MFVWLPPGLIMSLNVQFMFFLGTKLCERRFGYLQEDVFIETFGISKLFRTKNYFDVSLKQTCFEKFKRISWIGLHKCWIILFCFWCEVMFCWSKRFKLQFDGYKELIFKAFILLVRIMTCFTWESIAYRSKLPAFDHKGLDWARNVGLSSWLWRKRILIGSKGV